MHWPAGLSLTVWLSEAPSADLAFKLGAQASLSPAHWQVTCQPSTASDSHWTIHLLWNIAQFVSYCLFLNLFFGWLQTDIGCWDMAILRFRGQKLSLLFVYMPSCKLQCKLCANIFTTCKPWISTIRKCFKKLKHAQSYAFWKLQKESM